MCALPKGLVYQKNTIVGIGPTFSNDSPFCRGDPSQGRLRRLFPKSNLQYCRGTGSVFCGIEPES